MKKRDIGLGLALFITAVVVSSIIVVQVTSTHQGTPGAVRFYRMDETVSVHPFTAISGTSTDKSRFIDLAPLFLEHENVFVSVCKGYAIQLSDTALANALKPNMTAAWLYCENGTARVLYGAQYNAASIIDYVFHVDGTWYIAWFASSYNKQMVDLLSIISG